MMTAKSLRAFVAIYLAGAVVAHLALFWYARKLIAKGYPDFAIYYCAGDVVRHGLGHQLYDPAPRFEVEQQFATYVPQFRGPLPYTHPPFETLFFLPFSYLSWIHAYTAWN